MWIAYALLLATVISVAVFAADRDAPFAVLSVEPAFAKPGDVVMLRARVYRDSSRECSAVFSRYVFDASGARHDDPSSPASASAAMIEGMEKRSPGRLTLALTVPDKAAPGPATLVSSLEYRCNKIHRLWPIEVTTEMPFTVLP